MDIKGFYRRLSALAYKEFLQLLRDNSSILIGCVLPVMLILLIGYGISLDVRNVPVAIVTEEISPTVHSMTSMIDGSPYFSPKYTASISEGRQLMKSRQADAMLIVPPDFTKSLQQKTATVQVVLYGVDSITAMTVQNYFEGIIGQWTAKQQGTGIGKVTVESRMWFNDANTSTWYFVPGLIMMIMTLVGIFLTSLVMAREWERGTFESMFVTPVKPLELLLAKVIPYFLLAMGGFILCLLAARYLYNVPMHGSLWLIFMATMIYLIVALSIGLFISALTKSQFLSCQISLVAGFMPSLMLTGFMFDLHSIPTWISSIGYVLPPTYYLELLKSLFLAGNNWPLIAKNFTILIFYAIVFIALALKVTKKRLE